VAQEHSGKMGGLFDVGCGRAAGPAPVRELVRQISWRRVDSAFEADWLYLEAARAVFPKTYQGMVGFRPAWFIHINPRAQFPRYTKTIDPLAKGGVHIGPLEDKHAAARLIELLEDIFDLCRYYNVLVEAPHGKACAYKEMGKCPAPCDGTIPMSQYRHMIEQSVVAIVSPGSFIDRQTRQMNEAAAALQFEHAGRLKAKIEELSELGKGAFRHTRRIEDFRFVSLQRGPREGLARLFLITPNKIQDVADLIAEPTQSLDLLRHILCIEQASSQEALTADGVERIGLVGHHLFAAKQTRGVFIHSDLMDDKSLAKAFRDLRKQKAPQEVEGEGVVKELQAM
jgi:excinuclease UvrABC nuclease subunit